MYLVGAHLVLQNVCYISASLCHSTFLAAVWCPFLWAQIILPLSWGLLRLEISIFQRYVTAHFSNFKIWTFPPFSGLGKNILKKTVLKTETCRHLKDHLHHACHVLTENFIVFFRVPTSALEFNGKDLRIIFVIQISGTQKSSQPKMGVALGMSKKRGWPTSWRVPFVGKDEYFFGNWICCRPKLSAMDWDEKTLKDLHGSLPKEGAIHQVRRNDGKFMGPNKNLGGSRTVPHVFCLAPLSNFFGVTSSLLLSRRSHGQTELHFGMLLPLPVAPNKCKSTS